MKKLLILGVALVSLAAFSVLGITQEKKEEAKPGLKIVETTEADIVELTIPLTKANKKAAVKDPVKFLTEFVESHGQKVNEMTESNDFVKSISAAPEGATLITQCMHITRGKHKSKNVESGPRRIVKESLKPGIKIIDTTKVDIGEATFAFSDADRKAFGQDPAKFTRKFVESHGEKVNGITISTSFEMEVRKGTGGGPETPTRYFHAVSSHWHWGRPCKKE